MRVVVYDNADMQKIARPLYKRGGSSRGKFYEGKRNGKYWGQGNMSEHDYWEYMNQPMEGMPNMSRYQFLSGYNKKQERKNENVRKINDSWRKDYAEPLEKEMNELFGDEAYRQTFGMKYDVGSPEEQYVNENRRNMLPWFERYNQIRNKYFSNTHNPEQMSSLSDKWMPKSSMYIPGASPVVSIALSPGLSAGKTLENLSTGAYDHGYNYAMMSNPQIMSSYIKELGDLYRDFTGENFEDTQHLPEVTVEEEAPERSGTFWKSIGSMLNKYSPIPKVREVGDKWAKEVEHTENVDSNLRTGSQDDSYNAWRTFNEEYPVVREFGSYTMPGFAANSIFDYATSPRVTNEEKLNLAMSALPFVSSGARYVPRLIKGADNATRKLFPSYDLYRHIGETKPPKTTMPTFTTFDEAQSITNKFKSSLDWDDWLKYNPNATEEDAKILKSHLDEYRNIEKTAKENGTWLKMPDGSTWSGDPRSWVQLMSKNGSKYVPELHYTGVPNKYINNFENPELKNGERTFDVWSTTSNPELIEEYADINVSKDSWNKLKLDAEKKLPDINAEIERLQKMGYTKKDKELSELLFDKKSYEYYLNPENRTSNGNVFEITYPKSARVTPVTDAKGSNWRYIKKENISNEVFPEQSIYPPSKDTYATDEIVLSARDNNYDVVKIDNVGDTKSGTPIDETIITRSTPYKSLLGNNGNFSISGKDKFNPFGIYIGLGSTGLGLGIGYGLSNNNNEQQQQVYDNGGVLDATYNEQINRIRQPRFAGWRFKDGGIYIKEENRGKFTEQAQRAGMTTKQFTSEVLENPDKYYPTTVQRARFSRNIGGN